MQPLEQSTLASSREHTPLSLRRLAIIVSSFVAITAMAGGSVLVAWRAGNQFVPLALIQYTPFTSFLIPGLILALIVGGASAVCATLAWRRAPAAPDAAIFAGGTLTLWITAEIGMMRAFHWLHALCGTLGIGLLAVGVRGAWSSGQPRQRWVISVTLAEAIGFLFPVCAGVLSVKARIQGAAGAALLVAAGFIEGLALGTGQARAFPFSVRGARYALLTALGAAAVWACALCMMMLGANDALPVGVVIVAAVIGSGVGLTAIGAAQWVELRQHASGPMRWIGWTAAAWALALPWSFAPAPFVDESTPLASQLLLWGSGGLIMAYVMALITWQGVRRLVPVRGTASSARNCVKEPS